jgi:hypothetical protein
VSGLSLPAWLTALLGDLLLPKTWNDRRRGLAGALLTCAVMGASVVVPVNQATVVPQLALAGLGLGIFVPANKHGDHARHRRFVRLPGRRPGQHGQGNRHRVRHLADGAGLAPR